MPKVLAQGKTIECVGALAKAKERVADKPLVRSPSPVGDGERLVVRHSCANLRKVLLHNGIDLYNGGASFINCRGIGTCGTCAVKDVGEVSAANLRSGCAKIPLPYHSPTSNLRLACQTQVLGNVKVTKIDGFWGQGSQIVWTPEG